jgi:hypothetical protein
VSRLIETAEAGGVLTTVEHAKERVICQLAAVYAERACSSVEACWEQVKESVEKTDPENGKATFFASFNRARRYAEIANVERRVIDNGGLVFRISGKMGAGKTTESRRLLVLLDRKNYPVVLIDDGEGRLHRDWRNPLAGEEVGLDNRADYYAAGALIVVGEAS